MTLICNNNKKKENINNKIIIENMIIINHVTSKKITIEKAFFIFHSYFKNNAIKY